jgi:hypothetical protein
MANTTSTQRRLFAPGCKPKGDLYRAAWAALDACLRQFHYRPEAHHTGAYNCRKITGGSGLSLHAFGPGVEFRFWNGLKIATSLAVDINWQRNPYGPRLITDMPRPMIDSVLAIRTNNGQQVWGWGGNYARNKDAMHFEIVCSPADLATGIDPKTTPDTKDWFDMATEADLRRIVAEELAKERKQIWAQEVAHLPTEQGAAADMLRKIRAKVDELATKISP